MVRVHRGSPLPTPISPKHEYPKIQVPMPRLADRKSTELVPLGTDWQLIIAHRAVRSEGIGARGRIVASLSRGPTMSAGSSAVEFGSRESMLEL